MQRTHLPGVRPGVLVRVAAAAALAVLMAGLAACNGAGASAAAVPAPAAADKTWTRSGALPPAEIPAPPLLQGASAPAAATATRPVSGELLDVRARLDATLEKASSCSADAECRSVATGAKACGGPSGYRAYSVQGADAQAVTELAQHERDLSAIDVRESGRVSACLMQADPGAHCEKRRCVTGASGAN